jgi:SPP1 family predicted phage head-tail adaptor
MDRLVTLQRATTTQNDYGEEIPTWTDLAKVWAERRELRGAERWQAQQTVAKVQVKYFIYYRAGLTPVDRLVDSDGRVYDIHAVLEIGRREGLELHVEARAE